MSQIPDTFTLFGQQWTIRTGSSKELPNELGMTYSDQNEILLSYQDNPDTLTHTLLHELLHSIETKLHLDLTERQVDCMALGLIHLFRANPNLLDLLKEQQ